MSLALAHKRKVIAAREQKEIQERTSEVAVGLSKILTEGATSKSKVPVELQQIEKQLISDLEMLKILKGDQQRDPLKADLIEKYRPLCEWYMANFEDWGHLESLAWWLVWQADLVEFEEVEPLLYQGIVHGLTPPKDFKASWSSWYCDVVKNHYSEQLKAEKQPDTTVLSKVITDIVNGDIVLNAPLKAKLFALYGKVSLLTDDHKTAARAFEKALGFDEGVGVKKLLKLSVDILAKQSLESENDESKATSSDDKDESENDESEVISSDDKDETEKGETHGQ